MNPTHTSRCCHGATVRLAPPPLQVQLDSSTVQAIAADNARIQAAITSPPQ
jgi:hypothetical protein